MHAKLGLLTSQEEGVDTRVINFVADRFTRLWVSKHHEREKNDNNEDIRYRGVGQCTKER